MRRFFLASRGTPKATKGNRVTAAYAIPARPRTINELTTTELGDDDVVVVVVAAALGLPLEMLTDGSDIVPPLLRKRLALGLTLGTEGGGAPCNDAAASTTTDSESLVTVAPTFGTPFSAELAETSPS